MQHDLGRTVRVSAGSFDAFRLDAHVVRKVLGSGQILEAQRRELVPFKQS